MSVKPKLFMLVIFLFLLLGCCGTKQLDTYINNHRAVSLIAEAQKKDGEWNVSMRLPVGAWHIETTENQNYSILQDENRSIMRWNVSRNRWNQQDKPFCFTIADQNGISIPISVKYPDFIGKGNLFFLELIASLASHQ